MIYSAIYPILRWCAFIIVIVTRKNRLFVGLTKFNLIAILFKYQLIPSAQWDRLILFFSLKFKISSINIRSNICII